MTKFIDFQTPRSYRSVGFEIDRVIEPLIRFKADKVWLIIEENIEMAMRNYHYQENQNAD